MKFIEFPILIFCIFNVGEVLSDDTEYYPSQFAIDNAIKKSNQRYKNTKRGIQTIKTFQIVNDSQHAENKITWRHFIDREAEVVAKIANKRAVDPVFHGHPKTQEELWNEHFLNKSTSFDQAPSLIKLVHNVTMTYLNNCIPVILYDSQVESKESYLFQNLLKGFPITYVHGYIKDNSQLAEPNLLKPVKECLNYIVFLEDVKRSAKVLGKQSDSKVVVVSRSSQWAVQEFLAGVESGVFINLLVIAQSFKDDFDENLEAPYILYTHKLYTDGLGASQPVVLNSWSHGKFSRDINLFPPKMTKGYAGHRFLVAAANQPPFVVRRVKTDLDGGNPRVRWDGIEIRLLRLLAKRNNFSIEIVEPRELSLGPGDAVVKEIAMGRADVGVAGMYLTSDRLRELDLTVAHSQDCAAFVTLMSTALPRYRAILGPFHWHVWIALIFTYLFAIFPLAFSDKHTLRHLLHNSGEVENMFWYVFGTFTNCFTFVGKNSWSKTTKITTRILIGMYWVFTIIITSCYTGCIIAFVTLPVFPETVDSIQQLLSGFYRVGTLDRGGWERWFINSSDPYTNKLLRKLELVPNVQAGIRNTTKAFFWPHAFLGSRAELEYIIQSNFTKTKSKRAMLHISNECFVPFGVFMGFPNNSIYTDKLSADIQRIVQSGLIFKIADEVRWDIQRNPNGGRMAVASGLPLRITSAEEKGLTLEDTQGMFLLLSAGFLLAAGSLLSEWMGGFSKRCRWTRKKDVPSSAISRDMLVGTPKTDEDNEMVLRKRSSSRMHCDTRSTTGESRDTLEGKVINVTEENIMVHNNLDTNEWDSRRSSSADIDKEVRDIFEKDQKRRMISEDVIEVSEENTEETASNGAFGDHLKKL